MFDRLVSLLNLSSEQRYAILDIGCGTGELLRTIGQLVADTSQLVGIDARPASIAAAQAQHPAGAYRSHRFDHQL
ncbi:MAG TPA: methyltransferase domain-containing protein, partial [Caldilineaceae bacterium]|nr:methyltransferase domain-containing protein [Caldilineaceae bacterium]